MKPLSIPSTARYKLVRREDAYWARVDLPYRRGRLWISTREQVRVRAVEVAEDFMTVAHLLPEVHYQFSTDEEMVAVIFSMASWAVGEELIDDFADFNTYPWTVKTAAGMVAADRDRRAVPTADMETYVAVGSGEKVWFKLGCHATGFELLFTLSSGRSFSWPVGSPETPFQDAYFLARDIIIGCHRLAEGLPGPAGQPAPARYVRLTTPDDTPASLRGVVGLRPPAAAPTGPGVYFLCLGDRVVYVGQSVNVMKRVGDHADKTFDGYFWVPVPADELCEVERCFIAVLGPPLNRHAPVLSKADLSRLSLYWQPALPA